MSIYEKHVFVCENQRPPDNPTGCCASKGGAEITTKLKKLCAEAGLRNKVRINKAGCLGQCADGPVLVIYPEGIWCKKVTLEDAQEIFDAHIKNKNKSID